MVSGELKGECMSESQNPTGLDVGLTLRDRIAAVLLPSMDYCQQSMTRPCDDCMDYARKKADAVIAALGLRTVERCARDWYKDYDVTPANDPRNPSDVDLAYDDAGFQILHAMGLITDHGRCFNCDR